MKQKMVGILVLVTIVMLGLGGCTLPSDLIKYKDAPKLIDLRNVDPESAKLIGDENPQLGMFEFWEVPNIGHYVSWNKNILQGINDTLNDSRIIEI